MTLAQKTELNEILKLSEEHARNCTIDHYLTNSIYEMQIEKGFLTIAVSSKMVKKAVKLFEVFIKRMYREGFSLTLNCHSHYHCPASAIIVDGEEIPVRLKEKRKLVDRKDDLLGSKQFVPTGVLAIEIYGGTRWNVTRVLEETEDNKWTAIFDSVIPYLYKAAASIKKDRLEREAWYQKMVEEERRRKELEQMVKDRVSLVKNIMQDVRLYEKAGIIRQYCDTASRKGVCSDDKLALAMQFADWIDPTIDYTDEILSEKYKPEDFLQ